MSTSHRIVAALILLASVQSCAHERRDNDYSAIDAEIAGLMAKEDVKGLAVAIIDGGKVAKVSAYGYRNVERRLPLDVNTVMYGASLTKTLVAYLALQLADEGKLDLDRPLAEYLPKPLTDYEEFADLKGDERWRQLTARHVLTHSTGLANFAWIEDDGKLKFHFDPGSRYAYSGTGFYALQYVLEEGLGLDLEAEARRRFFGPLGMNRTSLRWRADFSKDLADGYKDDGSFEPHDERGSVSAAGSMDTTIVDQAQFWAAVVRGQGLSKRMRKEFLRPEVPIHSAYQFPTFTDEKDARGAAISLAAGLGVVTYKGGHGPAFFKGGHNDWTGNFALCEIRTERCVVFLSNSVRAERIYPALVKSILRDEKAPLWWEYGSTDWWREDGGVE